MSTVGMAMLAILPVLSGQVEYLTVQPVPAHSGEAATARVYLQEPLVAFKVLDMQYDRASASEVTIGVLMWRDLREPVGLVYPPLPGDATLDGRVDLEDLIIVARHWGPPPSRWEWGDFNADKSVDALDLLLLARNWGLWYLALDLYVGLPDDLPHGQATVTAQVYELVAEEAILYRSLTRTFDVAPEPSGLVLLIFGVAALGRRAPGRGPPRQDILLG
jgi:hypothetical protein